VPAQNEKRSFFGAKTGKWSHLSFVQREKPAAPWRFKVYKQFRLDMSGRRRSVIFISTRLRLFRSHHPAVFRVSCGRMIPLACRDLPTPAAPDRATSREGDEKNCDKDPRLPIVGRAGSERKRLWGPAPRLFSSVFSVLLRPLRGRLRFPVQKIIQVESHVAEEVS